MSAPQMLVLMMVALQMQGLFTKQFLVEVETKDDIPNDGEARGKFQNKALSTDDGAQPKVDFNTMYRFESGDDHNIRIHDSFDAVFQRMKDETKDLKAELRVLAPTRLSSQSSFNGGDNEKRLLHRRCVL